MQQTSQYKTTVTRTLCYFGQVSLGCVWIWSSLPKIRRPYDFLGQVYNYELLGAQAGVFMASVLPILELILGLCLIAGLFIGGALLVSSVLLAVFLAAQGWVLWQGLAISCGCFGSAGEGFISYGTMLRTGGLLAVAVATYCLFILRHGSDTAARKNGVRQVADSSADRTVTSAQLVGSVEPAVAR